MRMAQSWPWGSQIAVKKKKKKKVTDNFQTIVRLFNDLAAITNQRALLSRIEVMTNKVHPAIREISFLEYPSLCKKIKILQKLNSRDNVD